MPWLGGGDCSLWLLAPAPQTTGNPETLVERVGGWKALPLVRWGCQEHRREEAEVTHPTLLSVAGGTLALGRLGDGQWAGGSV